jgi:hypothetical protein
MAKKLSEETTELRKDFEQFAETHHREKAEKLKEILEGNE